MSSDSLPSSSIPAKDENSNNNENNEANNEKKKEKLLVTTSPAITTKTQPGEVPEGYSYFSEGSANILYQDKNAVFYNPVQEFNRDMSIMMIKLFQDMREAEGIFHGLLLFYILKLSVVVLFISFNSAVVIKINIQEKKGKLESWRLSLLQVFYVFYVIITTIIIIPYSFSASKRKQSSFYIHISICFSY